MGASVPLGSVWNACTYSAMSPTPTGPWNADGTDTDTDAVNEWSPNRQLVPVARVAQGLIILPAAYGNSA